MAAAGLRWLAAWALSGLLAACGGSAASDDGAASSGTPRWVVLGSSTAAGVGASTGKGWAALLGGTASLHGATLINAARSGAVTYQALPAAAARPADRPATDPAMDVARAIAGPSRLLVLAFPSNDAMLGYSAAETTNNLLALRAVAQAAGVPVLLLSSQPRDDAGPTQRSAMAAVDTAVAAAVGACFVDVRADLTATDGGIAPGVAAGDGVHLNDAGHRIIFDRIVATLDAGTCVKLSTP